MKAIFKEIWELAKPYLDTRQNLIHTEISTALAYKLLEKEGGDEDIVIPAIILHDVGWIRVPENLQLKAFGPKASSPEINRVHELEGAKIAKEILGKVGYDAGCIKVIIEIIEGHDSRGKGHSLNDKIVKDADKLWRYSKKALHINMKRFEHNREKSLDRIRSNLEKWFLTNSAKAIARQELMEREKNWIIY
ncbi:MAG: HD domain-containing protein [Desulfatiglandales bacterium]|jgi:HD superfamily phosphodiesterase|nr:HD domain-containing protein [Desulfatiglandales bacterium]